MAYCRWSSLDFKCDIYAYEGQAFTIHVASNRVVGEVPPLPRLENSDESRTAWVKARAAQSAFLQTAMLEPIDLPHAGATFHESDIGAFAGRLRMLQELGYRMPADLLDDLEEEILGMTGA